MPFEKMSQNVTNIDFVNNLYGTDKFLSTKLTHPYTNTPIKGITKSYVKSMMIVVYNEFGLVPTLWTWGYI